MLRRNMGNDLMLEIVEGPGAGTSIAVDRELVIGRAPDSDLVLNDGEVSRHHARVRRHPDGTVTVADLGSVNGTFLNHNELTDADTRLDPGDELVLGVTVFQLQSGIAGGQRSGTVVIPAALATAPRAPSYVNPELVKVEAGGKVAPGNSGLDKYLDVRVRRRAQLAPVALATLILLALILYFGISNH